MNLNYIMTVHKLLPAIIFIICSVFTVKSANPITITAKLDSVNILMGNLSTLHIEVVEDDNTNGRLSIFNEMARARGYATLCGDSVELNTDYNIDTIKLGSGRRQLNYSIPIQTFDSGSYKLPGFIYIAGNDSAVSNSLSFNVYPVEVTAEDPIADYDFVHLPDGQRWYDWVPDWILDFWWIFLIIVIAVCVGLYSMRNFKKAPLPFISPKPMPKPWEIALSSLQRLKTRKLWEQGMEKEYFTDLTDILRSYLYDRFGINAMEMTTRQIMDKIYESDLRDKKDYVRQILNVADFVKFAKVRPLPADSIAAYDNAVRFVEETIPDEKPVKEISAQEGGEDK